MIRDSEFGDDKIRQFIENNSVGRNAFLNNFIKSLNTIDKSIYLSIDADWGSGKTVFMKQIKWLNENDDLDFNPIEDLDSKIIQQFREKYEVFYYNAWQNDNHEDPLQSLIFNLLKIAKLDAFGNTKSANILKNLKSISKDLIKHTTGINLDNINTEIYKELSDLVSEIITSKQRRDAVLEIIKSLRKDGKKFLFIIDELDRCNPKFAVNLLEAIKHYCDDDNIVFILSTNNRQLAHTVKKYYGNDFDGYGYLNRMYDLTFSLPKIDIERYSKIQLRNWDINSMSIDIISHFNLTMREINRWHNLMLFSGNSPNLNYRMSSNDGYNILQLTKYFFIPLIAVLKVHNIEDYHNFINGKGKNIIIETFNSLSKVNRFNITQDKNLVFSESIFTKYNVLTKAINPNSEKNAYPDSDQDQAVHLLRNFLYSSGNEVSLDKNNSTEE